MFWVAVIICLTLSSSHLHKDWKDWKQDFTPICPRVLREYCHDWQFLYLPKVLTFILLCNYIEYRSELLFGLKGPHRAVPLAISGKKSGLANQVKFFFSCFLAVLLELNNPGYSYYKSCCLALRPQTGDRLCNLVSFSIPLGFTGRCLTLLAGYLLATLKATFLLTSKLGAHTHTYNVCTVDASANKHARRNA